MDLQLTFSPSDAATLLSILEGPLVAVLLKLGMDRLALLGDYGRWGRLAVVVLASALAGFLTVYVTGDLSRGPVSLVQALGLTLAAAMAWYENKLKPQGPVFEVHLD